MSPANILGTAIAALLNTLWQSAALSLLVWAALRFLPRIHVPINAATRCAVWWAVLAAVVLLPLAPEPAIPPARTFVAAPPVSAAVESARTPAIPGAVRRFEASPPSVPVAEPIRITTGAWLLAALAIWGALSLFRIAQIVRSYRYLRGIKQRSRVVSAEQNLNFNYWLLACSIDRTARLLVSSEIVSPMAVGFRRPAVIVPETLMNEFTAEEMDHVQLHELAHIARYDDWTNLFARLIGALLPIHPVAVWLLKQIEQDREIACDDWVVAMTGDARPYAASLTRLFELCSARRRQLLATGMADRASHLGERIEALLRGGRDFAPRVSLTRVALGAAILVGLVLAGAHAPRWVAFAQEPPQTPLPAVPPVPPVAALPPVAPEPPVAPVPPQAPIPPVAAEPPLLQDDIEADQAQAADQIRAVEAELQAQKAQLQAAQAQLRGRKSQGGDLGRAADEIRVAEAELQARQSQLVAMQAQLRAQNEQPRQAPQGRNPGPSGSFLAALVAAGYGNLSVDEIIDLRNSGVTADYLRAVAESGWGKLSAKELTELARSGVSAQYLRGLREAGFKDLSAQDAVEAARSGVRPELMHALKDAFPQITMRQIVEAAHSGLNPNDLRQAREYGPNLTFEQVLRLKHAGVI